MSVITKDLGIASAYGYAKSKGYTGTEEEFAELMASYADVAQQAEAAAQDAEDAKDAAITAKTAAQTAQTAAESAQTAAAGSAQTASTKATEASGSAQTAAGSATAAGTSATAAAGSATTAQTAAQTATTKASEASSSASAASTAKTGAETARTGAQTAQTAAETAQANAEAAASSVSASAAQIEQNTEEIGAIKNDLSEKADKSEALSAYIVETETGAIASFTDGADNVPVKDLQVAIEPVQSGSGDPSPDNVRPISGWTGANVTRTGKNLFDKSKYQNLNTDYEYADSSYHCKAIQLKPNTQYTLSQNSGVADSSVIMLINKYQHINEAGFLDLRLASASETYTTDSTGKLYIGVFGNTSDQNANARLNACNVQIELGSTATAYEPYQGETYEVDWTTEAGTVYGGTLDVTTGVLTVDRAYKLLNGVDDSVVSYRNNGQSAITTRTYVSIANKAFGDTNIISSEFHTSGTDAVGLMVGRPASNGVEFYLDISVPDTIDGVKAWFANNPAQVVYELATPQTFQLTAHEVSTILGQNNIFADTGNVTVQYRADTKLYIDKVLNA